MTLGPIEVVVIGFPANKFTGKIIPELERVTDNGTISVIDGLFARKDADGNCTFDEFSDLDPSEEAGALGQLLSRVDGLLSDEDVEQLTEALEPNSSAAIFVFEHTWVKPLRDAIVESGGFLAANFRVPGAVAEEVLAAVAEQD